MLHRSILIAAKYKTKKGPRGGARYKCCKCKKDFGIREVQVDHIDPVIPLNKTSKDLSWNKIVARIFCAEKNLQVICTVCHKIKTKAENVERRKLKK